MTGLGTVPHLPPSTSTYSDYASSASSGQKRRRDGSPTSKFLETAKDMVRTRTNAEVCWNCEARIVEFAHVVARTEPAYNEMQERRMIAMSLGDYRNAMVLCPSCHAAFDRTSQTGWVFLPQDLQWFINWEERDWTERVKVYKEHNRIEDRTFPDEVQYELRMRETGMLSDPHSGTCYGGLYNTYILDRFFPPAMMKVLEQEGLEVPGKHPRAAKRWHGAPMASIIRGFVATGGICQKLPDAEFEALKTLQKLYARELSPKMLKRLGLDSASQSGSNAFSLEIEGNKPGVTQTSGAQPTPPQPSVPPHTQSSTFGGGGDLRDGTKRNATVCPQSDSAVDLRSVKRRRGNGDCLVSTRLEPEHAGSTFDFSYLVPEVQHTKLSKYRADLNDCKDSWYFGPDSTSRDKVFHYTSRR